MRLNYTILYYINSAFNNKNKKNINLKVVVNLVLNLSKLIILPLRLKLK